MSDLDDETFGEDSAGGGGLEEGRDSSSDAILMAMMGGPDDEGLNDNLPDFFKTMGTSGDQEFSRFEGNAVDCNSRRNEKWTGLIESISRVSSLVISRECVRRGVFIGVPPFVLHLPAMHPVRTELELGGVCASELFAVGCRGLVATTGLREKETEACRRRLKVPMAMLYGRARVPRATRISLRAPVLLYS